MPRPSDRPPPSKTPTGTENPTLQRQRLAQMETQLDEARSTIARQKNEIEELRSRIEAGDAKIGDIVAGLRDDARTDAIEKRVAELERGGKPEDLKRRHAAEDEAEEREARLARMDERLRGLEDASELARVRMRLERVGHRADELEKRFAAIEESQRTVVARDGEREASDRKRDARLARIESLFEELTEELKKSDLAEVEGLRARLDDMEGLVTRVASQSVMPPPPAPKTPSGDDLTQIKGIGPKTASTLHSMGITSFTQIAAWTDEDIEHIAEQLGIPAARIRKGKWTESAARLGS